MNLLLATVVVAAVAAQRGATPSGHALLLGTQRTGTTWAMAELDRSPCVSTTSELFIQFKWERGARMACLRMLYGDADARDRSLRAKVLAREEKKDQEYVSSFLAALRAKAIESMHALLEADADDDDA